MNQDNREQPKVRPLMAFPMNSSNGESICLRDPEGFSDATLVINHATYFMVNLMDGTRELREVQADFMRRTGALIPSEQIMKLVESLRQALFLDDDAFRRHREDIEARFINAATRPATHSGTAYPDNPKELTTFLQNFFSVTETPGKRTWLPAGIIVPHIDIRQAGNCYAAAYTHLKNRPLTLAIVLGTAHSDIGPLRYSICIKDFETPWGPLPCDREGIETILDLSGVDWTQGQLGHRTEHSVEFQAVFLRFLFPDREVRIIPVLCNSFADLLTAPEGPSQDPAIQKFIEALKSLMDQRSKEVILIAGADLSHIGPKFGHPDPLSQADLGALKSHDLELIKYAEEGDPEGFFKAIRQERDDHNVCGVPNIYTFLKLLEGQKGKLLDYGQFYESPTASAVSYSSLVF